MFKKIIFSIVVLFILYGIIWIINPLEQTEYNFVSSDPITFIVYGQPFTYGLGSPIFLECIPSSDPCAVCFDNVVCIRSYFLEDFFRGSEKELDVTDDVSWSLGIFPELDNEVEDNVLIQDLLDIIKNPTQMEENTVVRGIDYNIIFLRGEVGIAISVKIDFYEEKVYGINCQYPLLYSWLKDNIFCRVDI